MCRVCECLQRAHSSDGCDLASTLCKYDLRNSIILSLPLLARCLETIDVCIWAHVCYHACCCDCVGVCGNVCCVAAVVKYSVFSLAVVP